MCLLVWKIKVFQRLRSTDITNLPNKGRGAGFTNQDLLSAANQ